MRNLKGVLIIFIYTFLCVTPVWAKKPKPVLLVYGSTVEAYMAASQAALSGVPTVWLDNTSDWANDLDADALDIQKDLKLTGGVWKYLVGKTSEFDGLDILKSDNTFKKGLMERQDVMVNRKEFLTIIHEGHIVKISGNAKGWKLLLSNKQTIDVKYVLDASEDQFLSKKASIQPKDNIQVVKSDRMSIPQSRSIIFLGENGGMDVAYLSEVRKADENFYVLRAKTGYNLPYRLALGQTIGAVVSYCAFFKTSTDKIDLRVLQNELLMYRSRLLPCADISAEDKHYSSLQRVFLSGILPLKTESNMWVFAPQDSVRIDEVKDALQRMYSRTQLWFVDNTHAYFTLNDVLGLIKFAGFRADELDVEVEKKWKKDFLFKDEFDKNKVITRYEFAVLLDKYASPFWVKINQKGDAVLR